MAGVCVGVGAVGLLREHLAVLPGGVIALSPAGCAFGALVVGRVVGGGRGVRNRMVAAAAVRAVAPTAQGRSRAASATAAAGAAHRQRHRRLHVGDRVHALSAGATRGVVLGRRHLGRLAVPHEHHGVAAVRRQSQVWLQQLRGAGVCGRAAGLPAAVRFPRHRPGRGRSGLAARAHAAGVAAIDSRQLPAVPAEFAAHRQRGRGHAVGAAGGVVGRQRRL
eukprot:ctg_1007.g416